jgi:hypothetical protein
MTRIRLVNGQVKEAQPRTIGRALLFSMTRTAKPSTPPCAPGVIAMAAPEIGRRSPLNGACAMPKNGALFSPSFKAQMTPC